MCKASEADSRPGSSVKPSWFPRSSVLKIMRGLAGCRAGPLGSTGRCATPAGSFCRVFVLASSCEGGGDLLGGFAILSQDFPYLCYCSPEGGYLEMMENS